jgi:hypothetical protein
MTAITSTAVARAKRELDAMRSSLESWLSYRQINDQILAGAPITKKPIAYAQAIVRQARDVVAEQRLATQLGLLLSSIYPDADLPDADLARNPHAAVQLAQIAIAGVVPLASTKPTAVGINWVLPTIIVGGSLLAYTTKIKTDADRAAESERIACIQAGGCTDYGFWLKAGGIAMLGYVLLKTNVLRDLKRLWKE